MVQTKVKKSKNKRRSVLEGRAYIQASYNNTIVTLTDPEGAVLSWSSAGSSGFKGTRKSTPYAALTATKNAVMKANIYGLKTVRVFIKGVGVGRDQALRGLQAAGLDDLSIIDTTPIPHNGCRKKKRRRI